MRSWVQEMGVKLATDKLVMRKCHALAKEDVTKFQDLSQCAYRHSNSWTNSDSINLTPNKQKCFFNGQ